MVPIPYMFYTGAVKIYQVTNSNGHPTDMVAANWVSALGGVIEAEDLGESLDRLVCERLPNGTVIARDASSGMRWVIQVVAEVYTEVAIEALEVGEEHEIEAWMDEIRAASSHTFACQRALEAAQTVFPTESGSVILEQDGQLRFVAVVGPSAPRLTGVKIERGTGIAGFSMRRQQCVVVGDVGRDPRHYSELDRLTGYTTRQMLCVPVVSAGESLGVLQLLNLPGDAQFDRERLGLVESLTRALGDRLRS